MSKVITFDIWDTIIKRKCHPEEIKLKTAQYILLKYYNKLKIEYRDIYAILRERNNIEEQECKKNKANGFDEECRILDVFKILQQNIMKQQINDITMELLKQEIEEEKNAIYINPDIIEIFDKYRDYEMYCISDFYMGKECLEQLFEYIKLPVKIKKIYSSADYLLNKRSGNLYKKAEEEIGITPENHIHVGDNQYSDIEVANEIGIKTIKINKEDIEFKPEKNRNMNLNFEKIKKEVNSKQNRIYNAGVDLAPLLYFFGYSIIEYAIKNKIYKIYYATREGETFIKIHELIRDNNPFGIDIPESKILEVSRMATFSASLKEFSILELLRLWSQYREQSMKALFKTLAIEIKPYEIYFEKYKIDIDEKIMFPWFDIRVQQLCKDEEFCKKINIELNKKNKEIKEYFEKNKIFDKNDKILMVDIGWRGTIQDNLAYIFNDKQIDGYYLTLFDFYNIQPENTNKISYIDNKEIRDNEVSQMITLLEWIYNPGTGSVVGYKEGQAIRKAKDDEMNVVNEYIKPLQEGMFAGAKIINEYVSQHPYEAYETKEIVYQLLRKVNKKPSKELIEAYYSMVFNDTFGTAEYVEKDKKLNFIQKFNFIKCRNILRNETWKESFIVYNDIGYIKWLLDIKGTIRKILKK